MELEKLKEIIADVLNVEVNDIAELLESYPSITSVICNGKKSFDRWSRSQTQKLCGSSAHLSRQVWARSFFGFLQNPERRKEKRRSKRFACFHDGNL